MGLGSSSLVQITPSDLPGTSAQAHRTHPLIKPERPVASAQVLRLTFLVHHSVPPKGAKLIGRQKRGFYLRSKNAQLEFDLQIFSLLKPCQLHIFCFLSFGETNPAISQHGRGGIFYDALK